MARNRNRSKSSKSARGSTPAAAAQPVGDVVIPFPRPTNEKPAQPRCLVVFRDDSTLWASGSDTAAVLERMRTQQPEHPVSFALLDEGDLEGVVIP